ncbi:MAG: hypothetical protein LUD17_05080 [Bacteroidales bacterium]|nr:hypothetical protein [Bacteroidales bacterium]
METILTKKDGVVSMEKSFEFLCSQLRNGTYTLSIKRKVTPRTENQNRLYWLWLGALELESGSPKDAWHEYFKGKFLSYTTIVKGREVRMPGSTAYLNTEQFANYLNKIQSEVATEWGITLPLPADRYYQEFVEYYKNR